MSFSSLAPDEKLSLWACLVLRHCPGIGAFTAKCLIDHYGSAHEAVEVERRSPGCWVEEKLVSARVAKGFAAEKWREKATAEWQLLQKEGTSFVFLYGPGYPRLLASTDDAPLILYYRGDVRLLQGAMVGVVGSRDCTEEGIRVTAFFSRCLARAGVTIVSGMARGIDRAAHISALREVGSSIAVLGTGVDVVYPPGNADLYAVLAEEGLLVSEFSPGTPPQAQNFPIRNRIISGLSRGILVAEASKRSGSLITARLALEQGREVFAVPGHTLSTMSEGCRSLIRQGAKPVFEASDVLSELADALNDDARFALAASAASLADSKEVVPAWDSLFLPVAREGRVPLPPLCVMEQAAKNAGAEALEASAATAVTNEKNSPTLCVERQRTIPAVAAIGEKRQATASLAVQKKPETADQTSLLPRSASGSALCVSDSALCVSGPVLCENDQAIVAALQGRELHIDTLCLELGLSVPQLSAALVVLEMQGIVRCLPGMRYSLP